LACMEKASEPNSDGRLPQPVIPISSNIIALGITRET
jgi:hypothetical protein